MLFNSIEYLIYLIIVFLLYWFVFNKKLHLQNLFVLIVSYIFYGWWDYRFLALIIFVSFSSWLSGYFIGYYKDRIGEFNEEKQLKKCKVVVAINIMLGIGLLGFFKYYNFFVQSFIDVLSHLGINLYAPLLSILLPVGISFYTFQAISYTIDVYRNNIKPTKSIVSFFAYVSFFPQLVAGPIERSTQLLVQFEKRRKFSYDEAVDGVRQMLWGYFKKVVIADNCAPVVNEIFENYAGYSSSALVLGAFLFTFQIYGDFSGYSDIAIGSAKLFGFRLTQNFRYPYFSESIIEFWKRWHISLNKWFVEYVYIPLGGSRKGLANHVRNIMIIFFLSGLWHGANFTFITWGVYHGLLFSILVIIREKHRNIVDHMGIPGMIGTFILVMFGWIVFRADSLTSAVGYVTHMFTPSLLAIPKVSGMNNIYALVSMIFIVILLITEWKNRNKSFGLDLNHVNSTFMRYTIYAGIITSLYFFGNYSSNFIYFQF